MNLSAQGHYEILRKIAAGGMAELYLARATGGLSGVERLVAIKKILPEHASKEAFVQMFLDEVRIAATLQHPNVVQMLEVGQDGDAHFIVMEYLNGENVRSVQKQMKAMGRPLALEHALAILIGAAAGLHYAHEKSALDGRPLNIVHRDVSPQNLFVTHDGAVKVVDFGIAKASNQVNETQAGTLKGKIPYMSPEQCGGEALDRRSDVYALGAIAYELTVGRRLVKAMPEYMMMKQIVDGEITPPSRLLPLYPPALEAIVMKALSRRRGQRYQTMQAFQTDLEALARDTRLNTSSLSLASMMREAFGTTAPKIPSGLLVDDDDTIPDGSAEAPAADVETRARGAAFEAARPVSVAAGGKGAPVVEQRQVGRVRVVSISGRLTEAFHGAQVGGQLVGDVVLDLSGIERVTSFGVREWLAMMQASEGRVHSMYLARCTEPIVNQLTMIRGFAGPARVLSFLAPYTCTSCGETFHRLIDAEADAEAVKQNDPPPASCPKCGADGRFDDDPRSYFTIAGQLATAVPQAIRAATGPVEVTGRPTLEKHVQGTMTRIAVNGRFDKNVRWRRAFEGLEGRAVVDLFGVSSVAPEAIPAFVSALQAAAAEADSIEVEACPTLVASALVRAAVPRLRVGSIGVPGSCATCGIVRTATIRHGEMHAWVGGAATAVPCPRCAGPLAIDAAARAAVAAFAAESGVPAARVEAQPRPAARDAVMAPLAAPAAPPTGPSLVLLGGAAVVAVLAAAGIAAIALALSVETPTPEAAPIAAPVEDAGGLPPWAVTPVEVTETTVFTVGHGGPAATAEGAVDAARNEAIALLLGRLATDVGTSRPVPAVPSDAQERAAAVAAYTRAFATTGVPERAEVSLREVAGAQEAYARYALARRAYDALVAELRATASLGTIAVARAFPTEAGEGLVVVSSADPEIPVGASVVAIDGAPVSDLAAIGSGGGRRLTIVVGGQRREVRLP